MNRKTIAALMGSAGDTSKPTLTCLQSSTLGSALVVTRSVTRFRRGVSRAWQICFGPKTAAMHQLRWAMNGWSSMPIRCSLQRPFSAVASGNSFNWTCCTVSAAKQGRGFTQEQTGPRSSTESSRPITNSCSSSSFGSGRRMLFESWLDKSNQYLATASQGRVCRRPRLSGNVMAGARP